MQNQGAFQSGALSDAGVDEEYADCSVRRPGGRCRSETIASKCGEKEEEKVGLANTV